MARVAIIFSGAGDIVESTVAAVHAGALAAGADTRLRRLPEKDTAPLDETLEALVWADGVVLGAAVRGGSVTEPVRRLVGTAARLRTRVRLEGKVVSGFTVVDGSDAGPVHSPELYQSLFSWGCLLVVSAGGAGKADVPTPDAAEQLGRRVAEVAASVRTPPGLPLRRAS
ncbi:flavodoxin family protein [Saccharomonospora cyanea]|uniref:Flavodoxin-like domain-containing protein n=1 Tax=Saccharomonospora cyanea NA-134 TaxID=882082 RepID=H5XQZ7_9PSEU|nr:hypothetical protein [Saccharomonospora cyanea]EHR61237.1 hypothetical protein SaccyDRAFT_2361 [Saccharomonospora cyanea NA-134]